MSLHKSTVYLKRSISQISADDPERRLQLEQLLLTGSSKPRRRGRKGGPKRTADFFADVAKVCETVNAALLNDVAYITEMIGPRSGRVSMCTSKVATFKIATGEFRLCTREEVDKFTAEEQARAKEAAK